MDGLGQIELHLFAPRILDEIALPKNDPASLGNNRL